jgi:hypothetical protein
MSARELIPQKDAPTTFIYALLDPRTREIRYIGKADDPELRFKLHIIRSKDERNHKANWIRLLLAQGLKPILKIVDEVLRSEWQAAECAYVAFYRDDLGCDLANSTPGGDGFGKGKEHPRFGKPGKPMSDKARIALRQSRLGKPLSPETRAKLSALNKGKPSPHRGKKMSDAARENMRIAGKNRKPPSDETRAKLSIANKGEKNGFFGKKHSPETSAKMSVAASKRGPPVIDNAARPRGEKHYLFGKHLEPETKQKLSASLSGEKHPHFGKPKPAEVRAKISASLKGEKHFHYGKKNKPETRAKMSAAMKGRKFSAKHLANLAAAALLRRKAGRSSSPGQLSLPGI